MISTDGLDKARKTTACLSHGIPTRRLWAGGIFRDVYHSLTSCMRQQLYRVLSPVRPAAAQWSALASAAPHWPGALPAHQLPTKTGDRTGHGPDRPGGTRQEGAQCRPRVLGSLRL